MSVEIVVFKSFEASIRQPFLKVKYLSVVFLRFVIV